MQKLLLTFLIILFTLASNAVWSADYYKGQKAYFDGDYVTALRELKPLAEQGDDDAQFWVGRMYDQGYGVIQNYKTAEKWYTLSAEQGDDDAQYNLGVMYDQGYGVIQYYKTAVKWYTLSAEQGDPDAQYNLALMYYYGDGVIEDNVYAHMWLNISASDGYAKASEARDTIAKKMTSSDISKAQNLARECVAKNYKGC